MTRPADGPSTGSGQLTMSIGVPGGIMAELGQVGVVQPDAAVRNGGTRVADSESS